MAQLRLGDLDFVIGRMAEQEIMQGFSFEHLYSEKVVFVARQNHPLLSLHPFGLPAILHYPVLMPPPDAVIRPEVDRFFITHGIGTPHDQVESVSTAFGRSFTRSSDAIWIISEGVVAEDVAAGQLALLPLDTSQTLGPVGLTKRAVTTLSLPVELLIQAIRDVVHDL